MAGGNNQRPFVEVSASTRELNDIQRNISAFTAQLEELRRGLLAFLPVVKAGDYEIGEETFVVYTGSGGHTFTLPKGDALTGKARTIFVVNNGAGTLTIRRSGSDTLNGFTQVTLSTGAGTAIASDGATAWHSVGGADPLRVANLVVSVSATLAALTVTGNANLNGSQTLVAGILKLTRAAGVLVTAMIIPDFTNIVFGSTNQVGLEVTGAGTGLLIGRVAGEKIGKWGVTPVVQPVLATGAGHTVDDVIAMLQSNGDCRQV